MQCAMLRHEPTIDSSANRQVCFCCLNVMFKAGDVALEDELHKVTHRETCKFIPTHGPFSILLARRCPLFTGAVHKLPLVCYYPFIFYSVVSDSCCQQGRLRSCFKSLTLGQVLVEPSRGCGFLTLDKVKVKDTPQVDSHVVTMAKGKKGQSPTANGSTTIGALTRSMNTKGGVTLHSPEERHQSVLKWVRTQMVGLKHCTTTGEPKKPMNVDSVRTVLQLKRPDIAQEITAALKE